MARNWWRRVRPMRVLVCSGGASRGAAHVGMARALVASGWTPDAIVGASAGALNAFALGLAWHPDGVDSLEAAWHRADGRELFPRRRLGQLMRIVRGEAGLYSDDGLRAFLSSVVDHAGANDLADATIPVHVAVVDLESARTRYVQRGPALETLVASCAIPGVLPPVALDGHWSCDGGSLSPIPLAGAARLGATEVVVFDTSDLRWKRSGSPNALATLLGAYQAARVVQTRAELGELAHARLCWIRPPLGALEMDDFTHTAELIDAGERAAVAALARGWADHAVAGALLDEQFAAPNGVGNDRGDASDADDTPFDEPDDIAAALGTVTP